MSGIFDIKAMEASDMVDVLHVMFEEDATALWEEHSAAKSHVRETIYRDLYGKPYKYAQKQSANNFELEDADDDDGLPRITPQQRREVKPYFPPTDPEDLQRVLAEPPLR